MSEPLSKADVQGLHTEFLRRRDVQLALCAKHESDENYGLAYLALWAVGENFAKNLGHTWQRVQLKAELGRWLDYLNGALPTRPSDILGSTFKQAASIDVSLPNVKLLKLALPLQFAPQFYEVLDSDKKYRKRRNTVAHSGEPVSVNTYQEFKVVATASHGEIDVWLSAQIGKEVPRV